MKGQGGHDTNPHQGISSPTAAGLWYTTADCDWRCWAAGKWDCPCNVLGTENVLGVVNWSGITMIFRSFFHIWPWLPWDLRSVAPASLHSCWFWLKTTCTVLWLKDIGKLHILCYYIVQYIIESIESLHRIYRIYITWYFLYISIPLQYTTVHRANSWLPRATLLWATRQWEMHDKMSWGHPPPRRPPETAWLLQLWRGELMIVNVCVVGRSNLKTFDSHASLNHLIWSQVSSIFCQ